MKVGSYIYTNSYAPADTNQLWVKPMSNGEAVLYIFVDGKWTPTGGVGESAYSAAVKEGFVGTKSEWLESLALKYSDLTPAQKAELAQPAVEQAALAAQYAETIHQAIDDLDPSQSTEDAIVAEAAVRASKDSELETALAALGPKINGVGEFKEVPVFIRAITDSEDKVLWGILENGEVYWGKGCPQQVKDYIQTLDAKLWADKMSGSFLKTEDPEFISVVLDAEGKILEGIRKDGSHYIHNIESETLTTLANKVDNIGNGFAPRLPNHKLVAAYNAPNAVKDIADYICDGENDEVEINLAMREGGTNAVVTLSEGDFNIDEFKQRFNVPDSPYLGIYLPWLDGQSICITLQGSGCRGVRRTTLHARGRAWTNVPEGVQPTMIGSISYTNYNTFNINNIRIDVEDDEGNLDNSRPIVCINCSYLGGGDIHHIAMYAAANTTLSSAPNDGCVGFRAWRGSDSGSIHFTRNVVIIGFYEAFQLGAEHHVLLNCGGRFNYYCFTFGNYDYHAGYNIHPIVLLNCYDEHSVCYPKFVKNGMINGNTAGNQSVTILGFNIEGRQGIDGETNLLATEETPGTWCGTIEYTYDSGYYNGVGSETAFWASGSGIKFKTRNIAHAPSGSTSLRQTYYPQLMQHYFDTDLGKELIYNGSAWVDCMGNAIV